MSELVKVNVDWQRVNSALNVTPENFSVPGSRYRQQFSVSGSRNISQKFSKRISFWPKKLPKIVSFWIQKYKPVIFMSGARNLQKGLENFYGRLPVFPMDPVHFQKIYYLYFWPSLSVWISQQITLIENFSKYILVVNFAKFSWCKNLCCKFL